MILFAIPASFTILAIIGYYCVVIYLCKQAYQLTTLEKMTGVEFVLLSVLAVALPIMGPAILWGVMRNRK